MITAKQQQVLGYITHYVMEHQRAPLIREIQEGCQIRSYKSAIDRLSALERKGLIKRLSNKHRGIRLLQQPTAGSLAVEAVPALQEVR